MGWLIVLAAVAMVIGSVTLLRPSRTEQRQMQLRQQALDTGLRVRLRQLQVPGEPEPRTLAVYTLARSPAQREAFGRNPACWLAVRAPGGGLDHIGGEWQFLESDPASRRMAGPIGCLLESLNRELLAVTSQPAAVGVYWTEAGQEIDVGAIATFLQRLAQLQAPPGVA